jgi:glycosyltransferase involved in cell wall biosynthesis
MKRLKVLMSAYACEPGKGSEPGVGWNMAWEMAKHHDTWVITRANNRSVVEAELARHPASGLQFVYYDLPKWARWWKKRGRGVQLYYYLWQIGIYFLARRLHQRVKFDLAHHVTFVKYWSPSFVSLLPVPFIWGPVGGGESAPRAFWSDFSPEGRRYEVLREIARWLGEHDPCVRLTERRSKLVLATTADTSKRLVGIGAGDVQVFSQVGLSAEELKTLGEIQVEGERTLRFISIGNLLHWKGFHLGLRAFAQADLTDAEYWIVGSGPERKSLEALVRRLGIVERVRFWGRLPREEAMTLLGESDVLVHPSLHDSGGCVCLEAMAAGRPVVCLDLGGPAIQVTDETGIRIAADCPGQAVHALAEAMQRLAFSPHLRTKLGTSGKRRASSEFNWQAKGLSLNAYYMKVVSERPLLAKELSC